MLAQARVAELVRKRQGAGMPLLLGPGLGADVTGTTGAAAAAGSSYPSGSSSSSAAAAAADAVGLRGSAARRVLGDNKGVASGAGGGPGVRAGGGGGKAAGSGVDAAGQAVAGGSGDGVEGEEVSEWVGVSEVK